MKVKITFLFILVVYKFDVTFTEEFVQTELDVLTDGHTSLIPSYIIYRFEKVSIRLKRNS